MLVSVGSNVTRPSPVLIAIIRDHLRRSSRELAGRTRVYEGLESFQENRLRPFLLWHHCGIPICRYVAGSYHPDQSGEGARTDQHRLAKCDSEQARAKQNKTGDGHGEETAGSEFIAHGVPIKLSHPLAARRVPSMARGSAPPHFCEVFISRATKAPLLRHLDHGVKKNQTDY